MHNIDLATDAGKCVLVVTGAEAKEACGTEYLCGGLEAGIEGGIHLDRLL